MYVIKRIFVWLRRIGRCRGFGIQSPWAFNLATRVINDHTKLDAYTALSSKYPRQGAPCRKLRQLYLRLASSLAPASSLCVGKEAAITADYILAGHQYTSVIKLPATVSDEEIRAAVSKMAQPWFAVVSPCDSADRLVKHLSDNAADGSMLVIESIKDNGRMKALWSEILSVTPRVVTSDLYYCGLVYFDKKRYKQNFIINF